MKREIALRLAAALDSGDYKQGRYKNRTLDNSFCIGGVLINLFAQAHPEIAAKEKDPEVFLGERSRLPEVVQEWAGLSNREFWTYYDAPRVTYKGRTFYGLRQANDCGVPFEVLATWLRKNYKLV